MAETKSCGKQYRDRLVQIYVYIMFSVYPLLYHNFYYDIVTCKYICYLVITGIFLIVFLLMIPEDDGKGILFTKIHVRLCDYFVLGFLSVNVISVIISDNKLYAITGADGRNMGLLTVVVMCLLYFILSRCYVADMVFYYVLSAGSICVSVIGILNFLNIDMLGFYKGLVYEQKLNYISTLGHIDVYTSYFALTIPMLYIIYLKTDSIRLRIFSFIALVLNICGVVAGQCDSGYIILGTSFVLAIVLLKGRLRYSAYLLPIVLSTVIIKLMFYLNERAVEKRELSRFAQYAYHNKVCMAVVCIFSIAVIIECHRKADMSSIWRIVLGAAILGIVVYIGAVCVFTWILKDVPLGSMENVLRFSDRFGSYRGYIWKVLIRDYREMNLSEKLFGIGTDTLRPYLVNKYGDGMYVVTNAYYDNAHNELIQYLVTNGLIGLIMYVGIIGSSIAEGIRKFGKEIEEHRLIILSALICYVIQSFVNINQVVTTPLFFILLGCFHTDKEPMSNFAKNAKNL